MGRGMRRGWGSFFGWGGVGGRKGLPIYCEGTACSLSDGFALSVEGVGCLSCSFIFR